MSDLIQTLRDLAYLYANEDPNTPIDEFIVSQAATEIEKLQQRLAAAEAKIPHWIPVSDSLPKECHAVLICKDGNETSYGYRLSDDWYEENVLLAAYDITVTDWMPLPEPPVNESGGEE